MLQRVTLGSIYKEIPTFSNNVGAFTLATLIFERVLWSVKRDNPCGLKSFLIALCKVDHITNFHLAFSALVTWHTYTSLTLATALPVAYTHTVRPSEQNARYQAINYVVGQTSNIVAKTINSFIIGKTVHEYFCKGQKPGALMAATTVFALGLSASNVYSDWKNDAKLSRQQRSIF